MFVLLAIVFCANPSEGGGPALIPLQRAGDPQLTSPVCFRGPHVLWVWAGEAGELATLRLACRQVGRYTSPLEMMFSDQGKPVARATAEVGQVSELSFRAPRAGTLGIEANAGSNSYSVVAGPRHLAVEATEACPVHLIGPAEVYFFVPPGAQRFAAVARGQGEGETAKISVVSPTGEVLAEAEALGGAAAYAEVTNPSPAGQVWKIVVSKASVGTLEDVTLYLVGDVSPYISLTPSSVLVPFCYGLEQQPRLIAEGEKPSFRLGFTSPEMAAARTLRARLVRDGETLGVFTSQAAGQGLAVTLPSRADASYLATIELLDATGQAEMTATTTAEVRNGVLYVGGLRPILSVSLSAPKTPAEPLTAVVDLHLAGADASAVLVSAALYRCDFSQDPTSADAEKIADEPSLPRAGQHWTARSPAPLTEGVYEWLFAARDGVTRRPLAWQRVHWVVYRDQVFPERTPAPGVAPPAALVSGASGILLAASASRDAFTHSYLPSEAELQSPVRVAAAKGEICAAVAMAIPGRDIAQCSAALSDLTGPAGARLPASVVDIRLARFWAQRTNWRSQDCWVIPELLEKRRSWALRALQPALLWLTFRVPADARPGKYTGVLTVNGGGAAATKPVELTVYPFELAEPRDFHWGLYTDSGRWPGYSEAKVGAELADYRAHGITSLMMYPLFHSKVELGPDGQPQIDASQFEKYMAMAKQAGLRPPTVL
ncbi:MAG: hypothetical protein H5T86_08055, partial [Armatimonadetes bacterium]|nr:hypothetical protein [Armatimonadota bacterium]